LRPPSNISGSAPYGAEGEPVGLAASPTPTFDVVVVLHDAPDSTFLPELREQTRELARGLLAQPPLARTVRRICALRTTLQERVLLPA
jgi:hypothetical protein